MCFSAPASFVASGALLTLGLATWAVAQRKDKILVAIPLLFGLQQFFEGVQWLYLDRGSSSLWAGYGFLFFALIVWPAYVPLFVRRLDPPRRSLLTLFSALGLGVSAFYAAKILLGPLVIEERNHCVYYAFDLSETEKWFSLFFYLLTVLGSLLLSSRAILRWFGLCITGLAVIAYVLYERNFISVWCFFAAIVSSLFFVFVQRRRARRVAGTRPGESWRASGARHGGPTPGNHDEASRGTGQPQPHRILL